MGKTWRKIDNGLAEIFARLVVLFIFFWILTHIFGFWAKIFLGLWAIAKGAWTYEIYRLFI